jgi:hypothetical protein
VPAKVLSPSLKPSFHIQALREIIR